MGRLIGIPCRWWRLLLAGALIVTSACWAKIIWTIYTTNGLFRSVGTDWGYYYAQSTVLQSGNSTAIYDLDALSKRLQVLAAYTTDPSHPIFPGPVSYPALFAWLFTPFTLPPPPVGFALWMVLNLLASVYLVWRATELFPKTARLWIALLLLTSYTIVLELKSGQIGILLACVVTESYLALRTGRDFRAGFWVGCLLFKPQYAFLIGPLLIWKRRWAAAAGAAVSTAAIAVGSALVAGPQTLLAYVSSIADQGGFHGAPTVAPQVMINWRALILFLSPDISDRRGVILALLLGVLTVLCLVPVWKGRWVPSDRLFPAKMSLLLLATLLANYYSHGDYAMVLMMPFASVLAYGRPTRFTVVAIMAIVFLPTIMMLSTIVVPPIYQDINWFGQVMLFPPLFPLLLLVCFISLLIEVWLRNRSMPQVPGRAEQRPTETASSAV